MEADQLLASVNKPSGLPRPSRLPVLRSRSSQILLPKQEDFVGLPEQPKVTPKIQKPKSIASLTRPTQSNAKATLATLKPFAPKSSLQNGSTAAPKGSISSGNVTLTSYSRGNQQKLATSNTKASTSREDEENQDQLAALDSFRSASRPGSRDGPPPEPLEFIEILELPSAPDQKKSSRPSLSDRTVDSIQNLPSTPKDRRRSSFFSPVESPMGPPPRPRSSLSHNSSHSGSRPGTSDGSFGKPCGRPISTSKKTPASVKPSSRASLGGFGFAPKESISDTFNNTHPESHCAVPPSPRPPSRSKSKAIAIATKAKRSVKAPSNSKSVAVRQSKRKPALGDAFGSAVRAGAVVDDHPENGDLHKPRDISKISERGDSNTSNTSNASSAALRQQIAAAKATARKEKAKRESEHDLPLVLGDQFAADLNSDPFNLAPKEEKHILRNRISAARLDGKLNIAAMGLKDIPEEVMKMYDSEAMEESKVNWAEVVDLTKLIVADNDIAEIGEDVFPDISAEDLSLDDQAEGNQFGGLEMLDMHGNGLRSLPMGLRRLKRLTVLNLAHNKLGNSALDVICRIRSLKELKLGHNSFSGNLPVAICDLQNLELLDMQANRLLGLPEALRELVTLKVLNISGNQLTTLPMEALREMHLVDLDASSNALMGALFSTQGTSGHPTLRTLKIANNSLAALTFSETVELPQLRTLDVTNNHLSQLPGVSGWTELTTLAAGDNKISELPVGFTTLLKLRNVNFTSNGLRSLEPAIARMESLNSLILASNPLREKKFLNMSADDIKRDLRSRLQPPPVEEGDPNEQGCYQARDSLSPHPPSSTSSSWALSANGTLDLAGRGLSDEINDTLGSFLKVNEVKQLQLSSNKITAVPPALWLGQVLKVLDLSANSLGSMYLSDELELPSLQELNISRCGITTLEPLMTQLQAPRLQTLDVTQNRLYGSLPVLRERYPALTTLFARDNKFTSLSADSLRGLHTVNLSSNDIEQLPAEVGLLWDQGLRSLEIGSNAFRVPNHRVLEKGTEAILRYLRDKIPAVDDNSLVNGV